MISDHGAIPYRSPLRGTQSPRAVQNRRGLPALEMAAGTTSVTGEEQVDSGLLNGIRAVQLTLSGNNFSPDAESKASWYQLDPETNPSKFIIRVEKGGTNDGVLGTDPVSISWVAVGK